MSVLIGQKLVENAKIEKFNCDILGNFQAMWNVVALLQLQKYSMRPTW